MTILQLWNWDLLNIAYMFISFMLILSNLNLNFNICTIQLLINDKNSASAVVPILYFHKSEVRYTSSLEHYNHRHDTPQMPSNCMAKFSTTLGSFS